MSQDRELDKYLEGKSALSQLYADLPEVELPRHLDAAILAEAHRAAGSRPGAKPKRHWTIPLGMAATLFIAVMIGLQLPYMLKDASQTEQYKEERAAAMMDKSEAERSLTSPEDRKKVQEMERVELARPKSDITPGATAPMEAEVAAPVTQNAPVPALTAPAVAARRMELKERADVDAGMALAKEKRAVGHAEGKLSDSVEQRAPAAATMPAPVQLNRSLMQPLKDEAGDANLTPADWLVRIRRLKQEGKLEEAKKELAALKKRYPEYPVPGDIEFR